MSLPLLTNLDIYIYIYIYMNLWPVPVRMQPIHFAAAATCCHLHSMQIWPKLPAASKHLHHSSSTLEGHHQLTLASRSEGDNLSHEGHPRAALM